MIIMGFIPNKFKNYPLYDFEKEAKFFLDGHKPVITVEPPYQNGETFNKLNEPWRLREIDDNGVYYFFQSEKTHEYYLKFLDEIVDRTAHHNWCPSISRMQMISMKMGVLLGYPTDAVAYYTTRYANSTYGVLFGGDYAKPGYMNFHGLHFGIDLKDIESYIATLREMYDVPDTYNGGILVCDNKGNNVRQLRPMEVIEYE